METPVLTVKVTEARHIAAMDKGGTSDPYCRLKCNFNKQRFKTRVIDKTLTPKWDESFKFFAPSQPEGQVILKMWDKDRWTTDDFLGEVTIEINKFADGKPHDMWITLNHEPKKKDGSPKGEVHVTITYEDGRKKDAAAASADHTSSSTTGAPANGNGASPPATSTPAPADAKAEKLEDKYEIGKELGRGGFSIVKKGKNKRTGDEVAIKCINKKNLKKDELQLLTREISIMQKLRHKSIIQLIDIFETPNELFLVLELVSGGELFDQIVERGNYSENDAANLIRQVLEGIDYMHKHGVVHRDLKPENLLCASANVIKIADFGLSKDVESGNLQTSCGTPSYVAPEVLLGGQYDNEVDIWSIGVITYVLLCGFTPFYGDNQRQLFERILHAKFDFPSPEWDDVSANAKDFVSKLLVVNPAERLSAEQAQAHPWILEQAPKRTLKSFASVQSGLRSLQEAKVVK
jgi:tRNA A-37 threonylcarbamoyl transferase component Bud32